MKRIKTLTTRNLKGTMKKGGCGECQTSCQSACKTSCTVGNQSCEKAKRSKKGPSEEVQTTEEKKVTYILSSVFPSKEIADEVFEILHEQR